MKEPACADSVKDVWIYSTQIHSGVLALILRGTCRSTLREAGAGARRAGLRSARPAGGGFSALLSAAGQFCAFCGRPAHAGRDATKAPRAGVSAGSFPGRGISAAPGLRVVPLTGGLLLYVYSVLVFKISRPLRVCLQAPRWRVGPVAVRTVAWVWFHRQLAAGERLV